VVCVSSEASTMISEFMKLETLIEQETLMKLET
jgi:hypothetical protein